MVGFASSIKPYFTATHRAHMMMYGNKFDLWDPAQVQKEWNNINTKVATRDMPPDGEWDDMTKDRFLVDFAAWKAAGYPA
jgi:hypothetical protein